jgi:hypothetical protein
MPAGFSRIEGLLKALDDRKSLIRHGLLTMVDVAQLVEPRVVIPAVVGSSPIVHPISRRDSFRAVSSVGRAGDS